MLPLAVAAGRASSFHVFVIQVLLSANRPLFSLLKETGPGASRSDLISAVELGCLYLAQFFAGNDFSLCLEVDGPEWAHARRSATVRDWSDQPEIDQNSRP